MKFDQPSSRYTIHIRLNKTYVNIFIKFLLIIFMISVPIYLYVESSYVLYYIISICFIITSITLLFIIKDREIKIVFWEYFILIIWIICILSVVLIPTLYDYTNNWIYWNKINIVSWFGFICYVIITLYFPGYGIIKWLTREEDLGFIGTSLLAIGISMFINSSSTIFYRHIYGFISLQKIKYLMIVINVILFILLFIQKLRSKNTMREVKINIKDMLVAFGILGLVIFIIVSIFELHFPFNLEPHWDQYRHYGSILRMIDGNRVVTIRYLGFITYNAPIMANGYLPTLNSYMLLFFTNILPCLSYYNLCRTKISRIYSLLTTAIYVMFSGFGGLYSIWMALKLGTKITLEIASRTSPITLNIFNGFGDIFIFYTPRSIGMFIFFLILWLFHKNIEPYFYKIFIMSILFSFGFLTHIVEMIFLAILGPILLITYNKYLNNNMDIPLLKIVGVIMSIIFLNIFNNINHVIMVGKIYDQYTRTIQITIFLTILSIIIVRSLLLMEDKNLKKYITNKKLLYKDIIKIVNIKFTNVVILFILFSFFVWKVWIYKGAQEPGYIVPWFLYPVSLGIPLLLGVLSFKLFNKNEKPFFILGVTIVTISFIIARFMNFLYRMGVEIPILEIVMRFFMWSGIAMLSSLVVIRLFKKTIFTKNFTYVLVISFIFFAGYLPSVITPYAHASVYHFMSSKDLDALNVVKKKVDPECAILSPRYTGEWFSSFSGRVVHDMIYDRTAFASKNIEHILNIIDKNHFSYYGMKTKYVAFPTDPKRTFGFTLDYEDGFIWIVKDYFPELVRGESFIVYENPLISAPTIKSKTALLKMPFSSPLMTPKEKSKINSYEYSILLLSVNNKNYTLVTPSEFLTYQDRFSKLIVSQPISIEFQRELEKWVADGGSVIVFNNDGRNIWSHDNQNMSSFAFIDNWQGSINGIEGSFTLNIPLLNIDNKLLKKDNNSETLATYTWNGKPVYPYSKCYDIGKGKIIYVENWPIFNLLNSSKELDLNFNMYNLSGLLDLANLSLPNNRLSQIHNWYVLLYENMNLYDVEFTTDRIDSSCLKDAVLSFHNINISANDDHFEIMKIKMDYDAIMKFEADTAKVLGGDGNLIEIYLGPDSLLNINAGSKNQTYIIFKDSNNLNHTLVVNKSISLRFINEQKIFLRTPLVKAKRVKSEISETSFSGEFNIESSDGISTIFSNVHGLNNYAIHPNPPQSTLYEEPNIFPILFICLLIVGVHSLLSKHINVRFFIKVKNECEL
ncbi:MAG: hypothetical protein ACFFDN_00650 [Candidatus Hodarchaeota archaeon]